MERQHDRQHGGLGPDASGQGDAMADSLRGEFRPVRWYQDIGIHRSVRPFAIIAWLCLAESWEAVIDINQSDLCVLAWGRTGLARRNTRSCKWERGPASACPSSTTS